MLSRKMCTMIDIMLEVRIRSCQAPFETLAMDTRWQVRIMHMLYQRVAILQRHQVVRYQARQPRQPHLHQIGKAIRATTKRMRPIMPSSEQQERSVPLQMVATHLQEANSKRWEVFHHMHRMLELSWLMHTATESFPEARPIGQMRKLSKNWMTRCHFSTLRSCDLTKLEHSIHSCHYFVASRAIFPLWKVTACGLSFFFLDSEHFYHFEWVMMNDCYIV